MSTEFNASVSVSEVLTNTLQSNVRELAIKCIKEAAQRHGFNADEEIALLGLENVSIVRKKMARKPVLEKQNDISSSKSAKASSKKEKVSKNVFPFPFIKEIVNVDGCQGLAYNKGLFTQCLKNRLENGLFCNGCQTEANNNAFHQPNCGTVETRLASDLYTFKDPNGRSPVSYMLFLEKSKISPNTAVEEATKLNITIPIEHFDIIKSDKKSKGRPKKINSNVEIEAVDLFSKLSDEKEFNIVEDDEEEIKKAQLEEERNKKKEEREQKLAEEKAEKAAKAEVKNKLAREKALVALEKVRLELEKEQEKKKEQTQSQEKECNNFEAPQIKEEQKEQPTKVTVSKIQICGKIYLKSSVNILYDPDTKEEVGIWDPETKTIKDLPDEYYETDDDEDVSTSRSRDTLNNNRRFGSGNNDEYISEEKERHIQEVLAVSLHDVGGGWSDSVAVCEVVDEVLKFAITESLKYDAPKLSGIKAQERLESQKHKNKPKAKNTTIAGFEFQNEKIRKQWN